MANYFQKLNTTNQKPTYDESEKVEEVIKSNRLHGEIVSLDTTEKRIVFLNNAGQINYNFNVSNKSIIENIYLHKMNISNEDIIKTLKENLVLKCIDGTYVMKDKDTMNLDKMIGLACIAMNQSEKNNKRLRTRNLILENKCSDFDQLVEERNLLKSILNEIVINLCLALGRRVDDNENVMHLINMCAALYARENNGYESIFKENDKLKYILDAQRTRIRMNASNHLDGILNSLEKLKEDMLVKDMKEIDEYKERQYNLQCENEKLKSEIEQYRLEQNILMRKENEHNDLKKEYSRLQCMYNDLMKEKALSKMSDNKYLVEKCTLNEFMIETLTTYLNEQVKKFKKINATHHNEKTKCQITEIHKQKIINELTAQIQEKNGYVQSIQKECCNLKNRLNCAKFEIINLKKNISVFDYVLNENDQTITRLVDAEVGWKNQVNELEKELKLKMNQIILTEKLAKLQLQEAYNHIQHIFAEISITK